MEYQELITNLAADTKYTRREIRKILQMLAQHVRAALKDGRDVHVYGLGKFMNLPSAARVGRHPITGDRIDIPATRRVRFIPADDLKTSVQASDVLFKEENLELKYGLPRKEKKRGQVRSRDRPKEGAQGKEGRSRE